MGKNKYLNIKLTHAEFEYVIYELFEKAIRHSLPSTKLEIYRIGYEWREQAKKQGWELKDG